MDISALSNASIGRTEYNIQKQQKQLDSFQSVLDKAMDDGDQDKLKDACVEFESYFINMMLKEMRKTVDDSNSLIPKSSGEKIFQEMLDEETSKNVSERGGIGLADMIYKQMTRTTIHQE